jgi:hypothetical protein
MQPGGATGSGGGNSWPFTNMIYVDGEHDLVAVVRWIDGRAEDGFLRRLLAAANAI